MGKKTAKTAQIKTPPGLGLAIFLLLVLAMILFFIFWANPETRSCLLDAVNC